MVTPVAGSAGQLLCCTLVCCTLVWFSLTRSEISVQHLLYNCLALAWSFGVTTSWLLSDDASFVCHILSVLFSDERPQLVKWASWPPTTVKSLIDWLIDCRWASTLKWLGCCCERSDECASYAWYWHNVSLNAQIVARVCRWLLAQAISTEVWALTPCWWMETLEWYIWLIRALL